MSDTANEMVLYAMNTNSDHEFYGILCQYNIRQTGNKERRGKWRIQKQLANDT